MLLISSDYRALSDFPNRDQWLVYRQQLRQLPETWCVGDPFPEPPSK